MNKRRWIILISVLVVVAVAAFLLLRQKGSSAPKYQTATITRGDLQATVTSTGTITAVGTVNVGTQVSGTVEEVLVDYNDQVHRGQLLARLDTRVLESSVQDAAANVDKAQAQYAAALDQYNRNKTLYDKKYISAIEFNQYQSGYQSAKATLTSAQVALQRARTNLGFTEIRSPTDGTVIQRAVEPGQTVAASLSTPTLFTIAHDLSHMQIEASVDESDIGQIEVGQQTSFTVQSQADKTFTGLVKQIRLQPQTVQNVVNYTVVVDARNPDGQLLPGMTATVSFEVKHVTNVLIVPNAALRFQPPADVLAEIQKTAQQRGDSSTTRRRSDSTSRGDSTRRGDSSRQTDSTRRGSSSGSASGGATGASRGRSRSQVWVVDSSGALHMVPVHIGLTDGQKTEINGRDLGEGTVVATGLVQPTTTAPKSGSGLPFGAPAGAGGGGRGGGGRGG